MRWSVPGIGGGSREATCCSSLSSGAGTICAPNLTSYGLVPNQQTLPIVDQLLGQHVTVRVEQADGVAAAPRCFDALVAQATMTGVDGKYFRYLITARPWFWFLSHTHDCRIFQDLTVREIIAPSGTRTLSEVVAQTCAVLLMLVVTVTLIDVFSAWLRNRFI